MGFNVPGNLSQYAGSGHYGLLGLRERAELIGAELEIESGPGKGTRISVTLPVQTNESE
jgi:signal transduction histidine kinase